MKQLIRYLIWFLLLFAGYNSHSQNNTVYGAGISYTNGAPTWAPNPRTSRAAVDTVTGRWYHFNTPGGWQWIGNTVEEIAGCAAPAYTPSKGDSRLVINNCLKPQVYWYDGTAWKWINEGTTYFAGEGIRIESNTIILDSLYVLRFRTGSNTDGAAGTMSWNTTEETVDLVTDQGSVTGHLLESAYYNTRNTTGSSITIGTVVMANGTTGNTGRILIAPAIADGSVNSEYILGLAAQTIGNNSNGKVQHFGKIRGIQTNGANYGETWVDGDVLYCSSATPGYLTKVLPTAPNLKVPIAIVIHAHPSNGTLFVRPSHFPDLAQINDVQLSSPTNGQVLTYNSTLSRWENATPANQLQTLSTNGSAGNISISSGNTITLNVNDADASATNELQTLSVAANTATLSNSGGSVTIAGAGINTVGTAGTTITVTGTEVDGSTTNELQTLSTGTNTLTLSNGGGTVTVDTDPSTDVTGSGASGQVSFWTGAQTQSGDNSLFWDNTLKRLSITGLGNQSSGNTVSSFIINNAAEQTFKVCDNFGFEAGRGLFYSETGNSSTQGASTLNSTKLSFTFGSGNTNFNMLNGSVANIVCNNNTVFRGFPSASNCVTIGSSDNPSYTLDVRGTAGHLGVRGNSMLGATGSAAAARLHVVGSGTSSSTWTAQFHNSAGNNNALMIRDDGNVGIGTSSPGAGLHVVGTATTLQTDVFRVVNGNNQNLFRVHGSGAFRFGNAANSAGPLIFPQSTLGSSEDLNGTNLTFFNYTTSQLAPFGKYFFTGEQSTQTTGENACFYIRERFTPPSGNATSTAFFVRSEINQTAGGTGITRGLSLIPFLVNAVQYQTIHWNTARGTNNWGLYGQGTALNYLQSALAIGTTTPNASAALDVTSTTQGVLFPRMTTTQRNAITTPADGLVIYNTTDNKLQVRAGGAWVDLH